MWFTYNMYSEISLITPYLLWTGKYPISTDCQKKLQETSKVRTSSKIIQMVISSGLSENKMVNVNSFCLCGW